MQPLPHLHAPCFAIQLGCRLGGAWWTSGRAPGVGLCAGAAREGTWRVDGGRGRAGATRGATVPWSTHKAPPPQVRRCCACAGALPPHPNWQVATLYVWAGPAAVPGQVCLTCPCLDKSCRRLRAVALLLCLCCMVVLHQHTAPLPHAASQHHRAHLMQCASVCACAKAA